MILSWRKRKTLIQNYDIELMYHRRYAAQLETFAPNVHILTVVDRDSGEFCRLLYKSKQKLRRDWVIVEGEL